ncbi:MAG: type II toxin-antitoxin system RelE family toxin [Chthoniobacterales bacterium]
MHNLFDVQLDKRASKDLRRLPTWVRKAVQEALADLEHDPFSGDYKKLKGCEGHRRRVGDYRILFEVDTDLHLVSVYGIRHRGSAY